MKTHAIIPIFIPHLACNNDCVFCNQKIITAKDKPMLPSDIKKVIDTYLSTLVNIKSLQTVELAFYGGSFTGLDLESQIKYLKIAKQYKDVNKINKIHISTRPDYINKEILDNLKVYGVDIIELGVQSFDEDVLKASKRGHTLYDIDKAIKLIKDYNFSLGLQLMIGLPSDNIEKSISSAKTLVEYKPDIARLYPTVIFEDTELYEMYKKGVYKPMPEKDLLHITAQMYKIIDSAGINIIRVGLKSTDLVNSENSLSIGYHPAFRQLVEGLIARETIHCQVSELLIKTNFNGSTNKLPTIELSANNKSFSNLIGHKKTNKDYFSKTFSNICFNYKVDSKLKNGQYKAVILP